MLEKSEFKRTMWLTLLTASFPLAIAIEQSASFNAKMSFTPSPVIATVFPSLLIVLIKSAFELDFDEVSNLLKQAGYDSKLVA